MSDKADEEMDAAPIIVTGHYPNCNPHYPEKVPGEPVQGLVRIYLDNHEWVDTCVDCGGTIRTGRLTK
jgi:hypothetical protein